MFNILDLFTKVKSTNASETLENTDYRGEKYNVTLFNRTYNNQSFSDLRQAMEKDAIEALTVKSKNNVKDINDIFEHDNNDGKTIIIFTKHSDLNIIADRFYGKDDVYMLSNHNFIQVSFGLYPGTVLFVNSRKEDLIHFVRQEPHINFFKQDNYEKERTEQGNSRYPNIDYSTLTSYNRVEARGCFYNKTPELVKQVIVSS